MVGPKQLAKKAKKRSEGRIKRTVNRRKAPGDNFVIGTRRTVSLAEAEERIRRLFLFRVPDPIINKRLEKNKEAFMKYRRVVEARLVGENSTKIAEEEGLTRKTVERWAKGETAPPNFMSKKRFDVHMSQRKGSSLEEIASSPEKRRDLGYLMGLADGNLGYHYDNDLGSMKSNLKSKEITSELLRASKNIAGTETKATITNVKGRKIFGATIRGGDFIAMHNKATDWGKKSPTGILLKPGSKRRTDMRLSYLKGIVDSHGDIAKTSRTPNLRIRTYKGKNHIANYVSGILRENEIDHSVNGNGKGRKEIRIRPKGIPVFAEKVGFRDEEYQRRLKEIVEKRKNSAKK